VQSLEQSSFDAWVKFYRPDENAANTSISYYLKGSLVCLLLDMAIRRHSDGARSLDDLLRELYGRYPISGPGIPEDGGVLAALEAVAGAQGGFFRAFFARHIAGTDELDYAAALAAAGLELRWGHRQPGADGGAPAWLGLKLRRQGERTLVASARADSPAYAAGVYADDELLALDGWRVDEDRLNARLAERAPGDSVRLSLFRGDALIEVPVVLGAAPYDSLSIAPVEAPDDQQRRIYREWLG
jgi:predicted metalloprotease with PDZ domain